MRNDRAMARAERDLQELTMSDPAAAGNMLRHALAVALLLTGRPQKDVAPGESEIGACFVPSPAELAFLKRVGVQNGIDQIMVTFDVDDACAAPVDILLVRLERDAASIHHACRLWCPSGSGRAVLVPTGARDLGHYAFRRRAALRHVAGAPSEDLEPGFRRAAHRLEALMRSPSVQAAVSDGWVHVLASRHGVVRSRATPIPTRGAHPW